MFGRKKPNPKIDHEKLGREIERVFVSDYIYFIGNSKQQIWGAFVRGIFTGLGGVIGATFFVAILIAILQFLGGAPVIGDFIQGVAESISRPKS